jgi:hypothetical protein
VRGREVERGGFVPLPPSANASAAASSYVRESPFTAFEAVSATTLQCLDSPAN